MAQIMESKYKEDGMHKEVKKEKEVLTVRKSNGIAGAEAGVAKLHAGASANPTQAKAEATAMGPNASAGISVGFLHAGASAVAGKATAKVGVGIEHFGAYGKAEAVTCRAEAGIKYVPLLHAHAQGPAAEGEAGASWEYFGGNVGASAGEIEVGGVALRAGFKIGAGIRRGVPQVDLGPVSCSIM